MKKCAFNKDVLGFEFLLPFFAAVAVPIYVKVGGYPVYIVQGLVFVCSFVFCLFLRSGLNLCLLDKLLLLYVAWNCFSCVVSFFIISVDGTSYLLVRQFVSLVTMIVLVAPYYVGRHSVVSDRSSRHLVRCLAFFYFLVVAYFVASYVSVLPNIYLARELIGQRIPMVVALISCILFVFWCLEGDRFNFILVSSLVGGSLVFISLTRAAYIQAVVSLAFFCLYSVTVKKIRISRLIIYLSVTAIVLFAIYFVVVSMFHVDSSLLLDRILQIFKPSETIQNDESASVRVTIWMNLIAKIIEHPWTLVLGFGQLGPSHIGGAFVSLHGVSISSYSAHSQYLDTIVRSGLVGLFFEMIIVGMVIKDSICFQGGASSSLFKAVGFSLVGVLFYSLFHESLRYHMFSSFFWFYAGLLATSRQYFFGTSLGSPSSDCLVSACAVAGRVCSEG